MSEDLFAHLQKPRLLTPDEVEEESDEMEQAIDGLEGTLEGLDKKEGEG